METTQVQVSRTLSNGKLLQVAVEGGKVVTTFDGVVSKDHNGIPWKLPTAVPMPSGLATDALGDASGPKVALLGDEAARIMAAIRQPVAAPRNPPCRRCGTHCYGDCTAA